MTSNKTKRTALITGASSGIGLELAKCFAQDGYDLILVARSAQTLAQIVEDLQNRFGVPVRAIPKNLALPDSPDEIYATLQKEAIEIDILVNNAGFGTSGPFAETALQIELQELQLNIVSLTHLTKLFLRDMLERKRGKILNVASIAAFMPGPLMSVYYATKSYVLSFSEALHSELAGTGITVTALCPGPTDTNFQSRASTANSKLFKGNAMDAQTVARVGYRGLMNDKRVVIPGLRNRLTVLAMRFWPKSLLMNVIKNLHKDAT